MKRIKRHPVLLSTAAVAGAVLLALALLLPAVVSGGIPKAEVLHYAGVLQDANGKLYDTTRTIGLSLWSSKSGGKMRCTTAAKPIKLVQGRFRLQLDQSCVEAVKLQPNLWVELTDNATALDRVKVSAAPYAVTSLVKHGRRCPRRYQDWSINQGKEFCASMHNVMVRVGDFWIDKYEMSITNQNGWANGGCHYKPFKQYGVSSDDYPFGFFDSGAGTTKLYACSVQNRQPSAYMTWFQAQQACANAGKRLCSNAEWQAAVAGTPDDAVSCNVGSNQVKTAGNAAHAKCVSRHGARDMVGNLWEFTADWIQAGMGFATTDGQTTPPLTDKLEGYGDGKDTSGGLDGVSQDKGPTSSTVWKNGMPAVLVRGGHFSRGKDSGSFALSTWLGPSFRSSGLGARCCLKVGEVTP